MQLEEIGFTREELQQKVIETICDRLLNTTVTDEDGEPFIRPSTLQAKLDAVIKERIDVAVAQIADEHVLPRADKYVKDIIFQETTAWGEKRGAPVTFLEYLSQRADAYLKEEVNFEGKSKAEDGGYSWAREGTRLAHMVHRHLHYGIERIMKEAVTTVNGALVPALEQTVAIQLQQVVEKLKVKVTTEVAR